MMFFVLELQTRRVKIADLAPDLNAPWMSQIERNLTDCFDGFLNGKRYLIHDRDPLYTAQFTETLAACGVRCVKLPQPALQTADAENPVIQRAHANRSISR